MSDNPGGSRPSSSRPSGSRPGGYRPGGGRPGGGRPVGGRPGGRPGFGGPKRSFHRKKFCRFCKNPDIKLGYKDAKALRPYLSEKGKVVPRRITGNCAKHQRQVSQAIERARIIAIIPFAAISM